MSEILQAKLSGLRFKQAMTCITTGVSGAVAFIVLAMGCCMLLDWLLDFPYLLRVLLMFGYLVGLGYILMRYAIRPLINNTDDESLALVVERFHPTFSSRLIAAIQLSQPNAIAAGASPSLVRAMVLETERMAEPLDFAGSIKMDELLKFAGAAALAILLAIASFMFASDTVGPLFKRALLFNIPLPSKTHLEPITGNAIVGRGDPITLAVKVTGWRPADGRMEISYATGGHQALTIVPTKADPSIYSGVINAVQSDFTYYAKVYDAHTDSFNVQAVPPPAVASLTIDQDYPKYTGLGTLRRGSGDLLILMGSHLRIDVTATKPCKGLPTTEGAISRLRIFGPTPKEVDVPLVADAQNPHLLTANVVPADDTTGFSIDLVDDRGVHSQDPAVYRMDMIPDRAPQVRIYHPDRKEILCTVSSNPIIGFVAEDDYGLGNIMLHYKVNDGPVQTLAIPYAQTDETTGLRRRALRALYRWPLSAIPAPAGKPSLEGSVIEYWIECLDNKEPAANSTNTEHFTARVVSKAEKSAELMGMLDEAIDDIKRVEQDESSDNKELRTIVIQGSTTQPQGTLAPSSPKPN